MGRTDRLQEWIERRSVALRWQAEAEKLSDWAFVARCDNNSPCVPKHDQKPRMRIEIHAAHRSG